MCARTGWDLNSFSLLDKFIIIHPYSSLRMKNFFSLYPGRAPLFHSLLLMLFQLSSVTILAAPCLHDAQQLTSFLLHTHCSSNYSWVVEEWNGEQKFLISWSVLWNWKIHTKYLLSHRRILCRLVELHIICEMNLGSWREGFKCPLKNTDVPPARLGITGFFISR